MSAPELWTLLVMDRRGEKWTLPLELVQQWLKRSGVLPLRIILWWQPSEDPLDEDFISLVGFLCEHASRWGSVMFDVPGEIIPFFRSNADITVDLDLFCLDSPTNTSHGWNTSQTILRPRVAKVIGLPVPPQSLQWTRAESVNIILVLVPYCLQTLENCNEMTSLGVLLRRSIVNGLLQGDQPIPPHPTVMQSLRQLEVSFLDNFDMVLFLSRIRTPFLRSLVLTHVMGEGSHAPMTMVRDFFVGVSAHLTRLTLNGVSFIVAHLEGVLRVLDSLQELRIMCGLKSTGPLTSLNTLFYLLTSTLSADSPAEFLAKLRQFSYTGFRSFTWDAVATFVESHVAQQYNPSLDTLCKRPLTVFGINLTPPGDVNDFISEGTLLKFIGLPASWIKVSLDHELIQALLLHHGIDHPSHAIFSQHIS